MFWNTRSKIILQKNNDLPESKRLKAHTTRKDNFLI